MKKVKNLQLELMISLKVKKIIDIKYSTYADDDGYFYQNVLIMYEENKSK